MTDMLQKSENVAKNLANKNSQDLTEQLKKGELKLGEHYYYTTIFSPTVYIQNFTRDVINFQDFKETVAEVLAPVPSYEEWKASEKYNKHLEEVIKIYERKDKQATETSIAYNELLEEYQKLKESRAELNSDIADKAYENAMLKSEYEKECKRADELEDSYWKAEKENKKFKELLKKARDILEDEGDYMIVQKIDKELEK